MSTVQIVQGPSQTTATAQVSVPVGQSPNPLMGPRRYDGYQSLTGSVLRNAAVGAGLGAIVGLPTGLGALPMAGVGAAVGAGSALIRHPRVANAVGDAMKAGAAGAAGGAVVGLVTPFGPVGGAIAGGVGGLVTGFANGLLKKYSGGEHSVEAQTTFWGRVKQGAKIGAIGGGVVGAGASFLTGGITLPIGAIGGALIGAVGGGLYGAMTGTVDAATGAKGARFTSGGGSGLPSLKWPWSKDGGTPGQTPGQVGQTPGQTPIQYVPVQQTPTQQIPVQQVVVQQTGKKVA